MRVWQETPHARTKFTYSSSLSNSWNTRRRTAARADRRLQNKNSTYDRPVFSIEFWPSRDQPFPALRAREETEGTTWSWGDFYQKTPSLGRVWWWWGGQPFRSPLHPDPPNLGGWQKALLTVQCLLWDLAKWGERRAPAPHADRWRQKLKWPAWLYLRKINTRKRQNDSLNSFATYWSMFKVGSVCMRVNQMCQHWPIWHTSKWCDLKNAYFGLTIT